MPLNGSGSGQRSMTARTGEKGMKTGYCSEQAGGLRSRRLISKQPASWYGDRWKEAFPAGNGKIGISVYGSVKKETILVNHSGSWHWGTRGKLPDVSDAHRETRRLLAKGRFREANALTSGALLDAGYESGLYRPCPVGDIRLIDPDDRPFRDYQRELDMGRGEIHVRWKRGDTEYSRSCFVSRKRDLILVRVTCSSGSGEVLAYADLHQTFGPDEMRMRKEARIEHEACEGMAAYSVQTPEHEYGIAVRVIRTDGDAGSTKDGLRVSAFSEVVFAAKVFGDFDACRTKDAAREYLRNIRTGYEELLEEHVQLHRPLFETADLTIEEKADGCADPDRYERMTEEELLHLALSGEVPACLWERLWHYGRYLFISGTGADQLPFAMYGLWGGRYDLLWSHNMANINLQMMYWHCGTGGLGCFEKSVVEYYTGLMDDFRENAAKICGMHGILIPAGTTPGYGLMNQIVPVIVNWISAAGWIAAHMFDCYRWTKDEKLLREKILPFMLETARFYQEYLVRDGRGYSILPSVSPENTPGNLQDEHLKHMAHACPTARNAAMDVAILKEFFTHLTGLCRDRGLYPKKISEWEDIIAGLPGYMVNLDGAVKEWLDDDLTDFYEHRHLSHLYPVFPGDEMLRSPETIDRNAFSRAAALRVQGGQTGWSMAFAACIYARLGEGDKALACMENLSRSCLTGSLLTLHNDWRDMGLTLDLDEFDESTDHAPVQLDAQMGIVAAVQEMLFRHYENHIWLLPALPSKWDRGEVRDFRFLYGSVSFSWDISENRLSFEMRTLPHQRVLLHPGWAGMNTNEKERVIELTADRDGMSRGTYLLTHRGRQEETSL